MVTDDVLALIDVLLAVETTVAGGTGAGVAIDLVLTLSLVAAGHPLTVINVHLSGKQRNLYFFFFYPGPTSQ